MLRRAMPVLFGLAVACSVSERAVRDHHEDGNEQVGTTRSALSPSDPVSAAVTDSACTTTLVKALATQLIEEIQCMRPGTFASIDNVAGLTLNSAVFPWLQEPAQRALIEAQKERGVTMTLNSALRTLPQQYLLYRWYKTGRCGIGLAAAPGVAPSPSRLSARMPPLPRAQRQACTPRRNTPSGPARAMRPASLIGRLRRAGDRGLPLEPCAAPAAGSAQASRCPKRRALVSR